MATIPFLGLGLTDIAKIGADAFNAKSLGEAEAERIRNEEADRAARRREDALKRALTSLDVETAKTRRDREREELARIRQGLTPTPEVPRAAAAGPAAPVIGLGVRGESEEDFQTYLQRLERELELKERYQGTGQQSGNEPPTLNQIQDASSEIMQQLMSGDPFITPDRAYQLVTSPEGLAQLNPALRLLVEGGQINQGMLAGAYQRVNGNRLRQDAELQGLIQAASEAASNGATEDEILSAAERNPNFSRFEDAFYAHLDSLFR